MKFKFNLSNSRTCLLDVQIDRGELDTKSMEEDSTSNNLPICNRNADVVEDVYNLYDIVPKEILQTLCEKIDEIIEYGTEGYAKNRCITPRK